MALVDEGLPCDRLQEDLDLVGEDLAPTVEVDVEHREFGRHVSGGQGQFEPAPGSRRRPPWRLRRPPTGSRNVNTKAETMIRIVVVRAAMAAAITKGEGR